MKLKKENKMLILSLFIVFLFTTSVFLNLEINSNLATNNNNQQIDHRLKASAYTDIDVDTAYSMINNDTFYPNLVVLDVRTQGEYDTNHICDAILIPHTELPSRISELEPFKDTESIVYCALGSRSATASGILDSNGFTKVFNMLGGITAWISEDYEVCIYQNGDLQESDPFLINGTATGVDAHNWTWAETQPWCTGNGTESEPYIIENIIINGENTGSCISIYNSDKYFFIRNSTVYNSGLFLSNWDSGIRLENVTNGNIISNNCSQNLCGIYLIESTNINISENIANENNYAGIFLDTDAQYCNLIDNLLMNNEFLGLMTRSCEFNTISRNNISSNGDGASNHGGIGLFGTASDHTKYNNFTENILNGNMHCGIYLESRTSYNLFYKNYLTLNTLHVFDNGDSYWNNTMIGNYWDNYTGVDSNGDGIGDIDYEFIEGLANANDSLPIYGDPFHDGQKIHIDGNYESGNKSWTWTSTRAWCSGSGSSDDPYVIKDLLVDGNKEGTCILIGNSSVYFKIEDCEMRIKFVWGIFK